MGQAIYNILVFPGLFFLILFGWAAEFIDRKIYARGQKRVGPPWYQPVADFIKLAAKEDIVPEEASATSFKLMPLIAMASAVTAFFYIPLWTTEALFSFYGDIIVVMYLLTIPTLTFFLGGWYSRSLYSTIGAMRTLTQLFAYEVPLFVVILASALLANTWSLSEITKFYALHPHLWIFNLLGFGIGIIALLGKLEKGPFDIPEAETEIVAGSFTEYGGRLLAFFRLTLDIEVIVGASLLAAVFLPFGLNLTPAIGFVIYIIKVLFIVILLAVLRTILARFRIDQMLDFCWRYLAPLAFIQILINLLVKGLLLR
ncbi:MAG: NADH-quinone oxidoreductase subunit H [Candidatus Saganbacteria bacterium]|nr:NADH-quinone oxidoreductase subunit H [Candidatus Saganbacteria bacterium]